MRMHDLALEMPPVMINCHDQLRLALNVAIDGYR
jgi:hypothetical protein